MCTDVPLVIGHVVFLKTRNWHAAQHRRFSSWENKNLLLQLSVPWERSKKLLILNQQTAAHQCERDMPLLTGMFIFQWNVHHILCYCGSPFCDLTDGSLPSLLRPNVSFYHFPIISSFLPVIFNDTFLSLLNYLCRHIPTISVLDCELC
jgi:hypothetical protein